MNKRIEIPKFASEEEEANWWFENRGMVEEEFLEAARTGRLRNGSTALRLAREAANANKMTDNLMRSILRERDYCLDGTTIR